MNIALGDEMLTKESDILYCFAKKPWKKYTFTELKTAAGKTSRSYVERTVKKFISAKIINKETIGRLPVYSPNLASAKARIFAGFVLEYYGWNRKRIPYNDLQKVADKIPYRDYVFLITGSYVRGNQTGKSDIDAVVLIEDSCKPKAVYAELSQACELNIPRIHLYVFTHSEFKEMLLNKEANYGKEIAKNCLILTEGQIYIKLLQEAVENGFDDKRLAQTV